MTTKIKFENSSDSNGDVQVKGTATCEGQVEFDLRPGESREIWYATSGSFYVTETWPTKGPRNVDAPPSAA